MKLIIGYFDPLQAAHTRRLREICGAEECVVVAVDDPPVPILPLRARQELVAALDCVRFVIAASELERSPLMADALIDERQNDAGRTEALVAHIVAKHPVG